MTAADACPKARCTVTTSQPAWITRKRKSAADRATCSQAGAVSRQQPTRACDASRDRFVAEQPIIGTPLRPLKLIAISCSRADPNTGVRNSSRMIGPMTFCAARGGCDIVIACDCSAIIISDWKPDYNHHRRYSALGYQPPARCHLYPR